MLASYAASQYQEQQVQTSPGKLVVMLYDGALRFLHLGLEAMKNGDYEVQGVNLGKAQNIVSHLMNTLDMSAGDIAVRLDSIYRFCLERLLLANAQDRPEYVEEVIALLVPLRDAWEQAERSVRIEQSQTAGRALAGAAA